jgi:26S proteasome subunit RPN7
MRQCTMDLGRFHYDRGDFVAASKTLLAARDHCASPPQMLQFFMAVIRTYVAAGNWPMVTTYVSKAEQIVNVGKPSEAKEEYAALRAQLHAVAGLAELSMQHYRAAAVAFSRVGPELGSSLDDVICAADVARYGTLTGLAQFDRSELRSRFLNSPAFAGPLESVVEVCLRTPSEPSRYPSASATLLLLSRSTGPCLMISTTAAGRRADTPTGVSKYAQVSGGRPARTC